MALNPEDRVREIVAAAADGLGFRDEKILVAVSGGIDSTVLLHVLNSLSHDLGFELLVGHVNHGLRGAESDADQAAVEALADSLGLPGLARSVDPSSRIEGHPSRTRPTLQEAARELRYGALREMAQNWGASRIATAHNLDDQVETVLMRLFRGCASDALGGIPEASSDGLIIRPLLEVSRSEICNYAREAKCQWREDSTNARDDYTRNRLRNRWIPELAAEFNPQLAQAVGRLAESHRRDAEWLGEIVEAEAGRYFSPLQDGGLSIAKEGWREMPEALARRLVQYALRQMGGGRDLTRLHLDRMLHFLREGPGARGGSELELPGGLRLIRARKCLILRCIRVNDQTTC